MKVLEDLCDVLEDELKEIVRAGDMSPQVLDNTYKAVDILKDIETIKAMKEADFGGNSYRGGSYMPYYDDDYSMARGGRGGGNNRYDGRGSYEGRSNRGGYSRDDEKEHLMKEMENMKRQLEQMQR